MKCMKCNLSVFEGDTGWYNQALEQMEMEDGSTLTFMDRIITCQDGQFHSTEEP